MEAWHQEVWMLCRHHVKSSLTLLAVSFVLLALIFPGPYTAFAKSGGGEQDNSIPLLKLKESVTRELSAGEVHAYQIALEVGQYFHAFIKLQGTDAGVTLIAPSGQVLIQLDCRRREPTPISLIGEVSGIYQLEVRSLEAKDTRGQYELRIEQIRQVIPTDKHRIAAEKLLADGGQLQKDGEPESSRTAIDKYREALPFWKVAGDRREEGRTLKRIGDVYQSFHELENALTYYNHALELSRKIKDRWGKSETLSEACHVYASLGENQRALRHCLRAIKLSQAVGNRVGEAQALNNLGEVYYWSGKLPQALKSYHQALAIWVAANDRQGKAQTFTYLGYTSSDLAQIKEAFNFYNQALALWQATNDRRGEAVTLTAIGRLYSRIGESQEALNFFERAMPLIRSVGNPVEEARVLTGMAYVYGRVGQEQRAIDLYERALSLFRAVNYRGGEASTLYSAGRVYYFLGDKQKALEYHRLALETCRLIGDQRLEIIVLKEIGRLYNSRGDKTGALKNYLLARAFAHAQKDLREETDTLNLMGRVYEDQGRKQMGLECYKRALSLSRDAEYRFGETATLYNIARAERERGDLSAARAQIEAALRVVESLRTKVASQDLRASYFASVRQLYELYIDLLMELHGKYPAEGYDAAAFEASESARARSLLETLAAARVGVREKADPELLARERTLRKELTEKTERRMRLPATGQAGAEANALAKEIGELTTQYQEVSVRVRVASLEHTEQSQPRSLLLREIRERVLDDDTLLLEFSLGEERSYLWLVAKDSIHSYELPARSQVEEAANHLRSLLVAPAPVQGETFDERQARAKAAEGQYWQKAAALSEMLLAPAAESLGTKRLLIVADGSLQYIPFNALPIPGRSGEPTPLMVEHEITSQPSASALATLRGEASRRPQPAKAVAVFADPVFEADDERLARGHVELVAMAQTRDTEMRQALRDISATSGDGTIPRLLASREEAEAIIGVIPGGDNLRAVGFDADKTAATSSELRHYRIIHFATHGVLDSEHPELSGLLLSRFDSAGHAKEGFLRLDDIYNLNLQADLVVLSACNTALGKDVRGEGLVGLVRGFMNAGTSRVVASLWKVDDDATAELMRHFYREMLQEQRSPAAALRAAQVAMWRQRRWHAPYFWAAFVLQGEYGGKIESGLRARAHWVAPSQASVTVALVISLCCIYIRWWRVRRKIYEH
ncbi:MAG: CHAT domain-containing tetratricopeptide repeat protein [Acidobacteriota bacterium]|nr:CHAT domain-containing tetratricopeptide repeat protein [Acidobacteriota bacterium]